LVGGGCERRATTAAETVTLFSVSALLGWNQVDLLALITVYGMWMIFVGLTSAGPLAVEIATKPELRAAVGSLDEFHYLYRILVVALYGTVIVLSGIFQGLNAFITSLVASTSKPA
jgi:hypothetical protein